MSEARCVWPMAAQLGEGPCWVDGALWFVDILGQAIHRFEPRSRARRSWPAPARISFALPTEDGDFWCGLPGAIHRFNPITERFWPRVTVESALPDNRLNDACVGPDGALWFGSMNDRERDATGSLYQWNGIGAPKPMDANYVITNGPAFSPDGRTLYHTDTTRRTVHAFDVGAQGLLSGKRVLIRIEDDEGWPDGTTVDAEGCLWVALWGGSCVRRYTDHGLLCDEVRLPCTQVTKAAFGGDSLSTLYVTTARRGLADAELLEQPLAGGLFAIDTAYRGLAQRRLARTPTLGLNS